MRFRIALATAVLALPLVAGAATAESAQQAPLIHGTPSDCAKGENPGVKDGNVVVTENQDGTVRVHVNIRNGLPNTTYQVAITCDRYIGTLTTNKAGNGAANIDAAAPADAVFGVDLANGQQGSPAGDSYVTGEVLTVK
jgi:hypothetical protein